MKFRPVLFLIFLTFLLVTGFAGFGSCWADVVEPGTKTIGLSYQISNINDYSEYVFLAHGIPEPEFEVINSSEFSFYKFSQVSIYAIKKSDFKSSNMEKMNSSQLDDFFKNDKHLIRSSINLSGSYGTVAQTNPLENAKIVLEIKSLNQSALVIKKSHIIYYFENGSSESLLFENQNINPPYSNKSTETNSYYLIFFALVILIIVLLIIILYMNKK